MKLLLSCLFLVISFGSQASTIDTRTFVYDGTQNSIELILNTEKTRTDYMEREVRTTCVRTEVSGYRTVCVGGYGPRPLPRRPGYPYPYPSGRRCYQSPVYRTISYPCTQTQRIPVEVKEYDVSARVIVDVTNISEAATPGETFKVTLNGDSISFSAEGSKKFFIVNKKEDVRSSMSGSTKMMDALLAVELVEAAPVLKSLNMTNISMEDGVLNFSLGQMDSRENIGFSLRVEKRKTFGSGTVLLNRELMPSEVEVSSNNESSVVGVKLRELGLVLSNGKFGLTAKAFAKFDGPLMNKSEFEDLSTSRTLIYKIR